MGRSLQKEERSYQAWQLRLSGLSYRAIAKQMGVSPNTARGDCLILEREIMEEYKDHVEANRVRELARLDDLSVKIHFELLPSLDLTIPKDRQCYLNAIAQLLNIIKERSKLFGLYAPTEISLTPQKTIDFDPSLLTDEELKVKFNEIFQFSYP